MNLELVARPFGGSYRSYVAGFIQSIGSVGGDRVKGDTLAGAWRAECKQSLNRSSFVF